MSKKMLAEENKKIAEKRLKQTGKPVAGAKPIIKAQERPVKVIAGPKTKFITKPKQAAKKHPSSQMISNYKFTWWYKH